MSIRNLDVMLDPRSVAVVGASPTPKTVGHTVWRNLLDGGFTGTLHPVNPGHAELDGHPVVSDVADLAEPPDLAVIATPPGVVPGVIERLGAIGTRAAVVLTAGLDRQAKQAMLDAARPHVLRILGPNCIGLVIPRIGLNATFAPTGAATGGLAFVSQSGALITAMLDWARDRAIGFSHVISLGEHIDVDVGDLLDHLATDRHTQAVLLYLESVDAARKFMSAARAAARTKPVIVVKSGRSERGGRAATSHTGALAGSDLVYDAAIARAGMLRVDTLQDLFLAAETLTRFRRNSSDRMTILTNGGGAGVMAADAAERYGVPLADLTADTLERLDAVLPPTWSHANPVDIIGDATADRHVAAMRILLQDRHAGAVLLLHAPTAIVPSEDIAHALVPIAGDAHRRVMSCWLGGTAVAAAERAFIDAGIATHPSPEAAVRAFGMLLTHRRNQRQLTETPQAIEPLDATPDVARVREVFRTVLRDGRDLLTEPEAKDVLAAYGIPVVRTEIVPDDADRAAEAAERVGFPVAVKVLSADITHKSDVGGVTLDLHDAGGVRDAVARMRARVRAARPEARLDGYTVQAMANPAHARELIVGAGIDAVFGPTILFGHGGVSVEVVADRAVALPPLNEALARALVRRTRVSHLLDGYRDIPPADRTAVYRVLVAVAGMLADLPELAELDINPLIAHPGGVIALDARMRIGAASVAGPDRFAITPYPAHLTRVVDWQGRRLTVRAVRPEDEAQHRRFMEALDPQDTRLRVFYSRRHVTHEHLARLTQIDHDREVAMVAVADADEEGQDTLGVVRAAIDPDNDEAQFGITVRSDLKGSGLGAILMETLLDILRERGTRRLTAQVTPDNAAMLALARDHGFRLSRTPGATHWRLERTLLPPAANITD